MPAADPTLTAAVPPERQDGRSNAELSPIDRRSLPPTRGEELRFAGMAFDTGRQELRRDGVPIPLRPKPLALLRHLLAHPGRLLGKDELIAALWGAVVVTDDSLVQCVGELRTALGDREQRIIKTLPRRGYMLDTAVEAVAAPRAGPGWWRWLPLGIGLALAVAVVTPRLVVWPAPVDIDREMAASRATAVLPLVDAATPPGGTSALANAIADAVVTHISLRSRPASAVIGRASTARFDAAALDIQRMGRELQVRFVVGGRITRYNGRVQVVTQLTSVDNGQVMTLDQSEYPGDAAALESNLAQRIASATRMRYIEFDATRFQEPGRQPGATELAQAGWRDINTFITREDLLRARGRLEAAAQVDPRSVMVAQGLGVTHVLEFGGYLSPTPARQLDLGEQYLKRAIDLAPAVQENLAAWADVLSWRGQALEAERVLRQLLDANPNYATARLGLANALIRQDRLDEARDNVERARNLSPSDSRLVRSVYARMLDLALTQGDDAQAREWAGRWSAEFPTLGWPWAVLAALDVKLAGRETQAAGSMARARALLPDLTLDYVRTARLGSGPAYGAGTERLIAGLRKAGLPER